MLRLVALWALLFGAYAATLPVDAVPGGRYGSDEARYIGIAESIADGGRLPREPEGLGFPAVIAPLQALGGSRLVALVLAAIAALGFVLAALVARRMVPEPWASTGAGLAGLSPPALGAATAILPEALAGTLLASAALAVLRLREREHLHDALLGALALAALPWLGPRFLLPAVPVAVLLVRWMLRRGHRLAALATAEVMLASLIFYAALNDRLYGGPLPTAALPKGESPTGARGVAEHLERVPRLASELIDRDLGLLRWAPALALSLFAAWLLSRSRRSRIARVVPERVEAEVAAALLLGVCAGVLVVAAFGAPSLTGPWFPGLPLVPALPAAGALAAWGLRRARRTGAALGVLTLVSAVWLAVELLTGSVDAWSEAPASTAPWGPLERAFPLYGAGSTWAAVAAVALAAGLLGLVGWEVLKRRGSRPHATLR